MSVTNVTCKIGEKEIKFETGKLALQAPGAVVVTSGETNVLVTTCLLYTSPSPRD